MGNPVARRASMARRRKRLCERAKTLRRALAMFEAIAERPQGLSEDDRAAMMADDRAAGEPVRTMNSRRMGTVWRALASLGITSDAVREVVRHKSRGKVRRTWRRVETTGAVVDTLHAYFRAAGPGLTRTLDIEDAALEPDGEHLVLCALRTKTPQQATLGLDPRHPEARLALAGYSQFKKGFGRSRLVWGVHALYAECDGRRRAPARDARADGRWSGLQVLETGRTAVEAGVAHVSLGRTERVVRRVVTSGDAALVLRAQAEIECGDLGGWKQLPKADAVVHGKPGAGGTPGASTLAAGRWWRMRNTAGGAARRVWLLTSEGADQRTLDALGIAYDEEALQAEPADGFGPRQCTVEDVWSIAVEVHAQMLVRGLYGRPRPPHAEGEDAWRRVRAAADAIERRRRKWRGTLTVREAAVVASLAIAVAG